MTLDALTELTDEDLKTELDITKIGHRRIILKTIQELRHQLKSRAALEGKYYITYL